MVSKARAPMKYPATPPSTLATVQTPAISHARWGAASIIGIIITSGGIGKTELSTKLTKASAQSAFRWAARPSVQS
ncbi:hypothetical protein JANAI62_26330 [Jannaschia pagri]|uniref:Uncharacterized protein n=1 Tax=Jannaschia pagri TaxID=2829797 RepID=A0ABQ4NNN6_9RHOB|nr:hypothetical protein JANAI61_26330 [Jannaschia sp. AI_61]GIT96010.1 hypothetical protein JANAI62_26330 [Jannaschia sp. AI_62]